LKVKVGAALSGLMGCNKENAGASRDGPQATSDVLCEPLSPPIGQNSSGFKCLATKPHACDMASEVKIIVVKNTFLDLGKAEHRLTTAGFMSMPVLASAGSL
jgi:hypothetical protein